MAMAFWQRSSSRHPRAILHPDEVLQIYTLAHAGALTLKAIGQKFRVHPTTIADIKQRRKWKAILDDRRT